MLKRSRLAIAMSLSAAVLCGCGGAAEPTGGAETAQPSQAAAAKDKKHQFEAAKADCMKQKGFTYLPYVKPEAKSEDERKRASGDYQAMKKYRAKYGFGVFALQVYPGELEGPGGKNDPDPNMKIQADLSTAQLTAYHKAKDACVVTAAKQVLGLTLKSNIDYFSQMAIAHRRAKATELDGDPELVELAGPMATCLKGKGYSVTDTKPSALNQRGEREFMRRQDKLGRRQQKSMPDPPKMTKDTEQFHMPDLTPDAAKPYLVQEVKAALDDLECGKDFYAAYTPKETAVQRKINDRFAF
ncbi:hypothetical protein ACIBQ6_14100 [Nonomuraea sp. NPDC049655]|uniref:hypothetical protein n=1 Tax=Nonomuraea sp. NPDC049655 TaxID=3364355 RepID=UPI00379A145A